MRAFSRKNSDRRPTSIELDFNKNSDGSALISTGNTKVLCTANISQGVPKFLREKPQGWLTAEYSMLPGATKSRTDREASRGKQQGRTIEIQRLIGRSLRSCLDLKLIPGYTITVDCDVLQADGGTRSAAITGGYVALVRAIQSFQYRGGFKKDPLIDSVTAISLGLIKNTKLIDLDYKEDQAADADINLVFNKQLELIEIQGTAEGKAFSLEALTKLVQLSYPAVKSLQEIQQNAIFQPETV